MSDLQEQLKSLMKPGTAGGKVFYGLLFFVLGLMFVILGFWKTLLVLALTAAGVLIGSADTLGKAVAKVLDRIVPPRKKVVYTSEDIEKVRNATKARRDKAAQEEGGDKAEETAQEESPRQEEKA